MDSSMSRLFYNVGEKIVDYLPNVFGAALLLLAGWALAWLAKRITVQVCFLLRPDRLLRRFRWGAGFSKADLRYALFNSIGSVAFALVFLAFLTTALVSLRLTVLSGLIEKGVLFLPKALVGDRKSARHRGSPARDARGALCEGRAPAVLLVHGLGRARHCTPNRRHRLHGGHRHAGSDGCGRQRARRTRVRHAPDGWATDWGDICRSKQSGRGAARRQRSAGRE
jgi:hypothetical protein